MGTQRNTLERGGERERKERVMGWGKLLRGNEDRL